MDASRSHHLTAGARSGRFELRTPGDVEIEPGGGDVGLRCRERRADGQPIGELEVEVFRAALVIDRDGILIDKVQAAVDRAAERGARISPVVSVSLPGASGFRASVELVRPMGTARPPLPYVYVLAIAPHDLGVDSGVLVTVRSARPEWPAADAILQSLRILGRTGASANDAGDPPLGLPLVGRR